jgi:hypothetical protein
MIPTFFSFVLLVGSGSSVPDQPRLSVCEVLDRSRSLNGRTVVIRAFLNGSPNHGYSLFPTTDATTAPCPGWPQRFFTAPSVLALSTRDRSNPVFSALSRKQATGDFSSIEVDVVGTVRRKWLTWIFRMAGGGYAGNGFGESGGKAVLIEVETLKEVPPPQTMQLRVSSLPATATPASPLVSPTRASWR